MTHKGMIPPHEGGCWYCHTRSDGMPYSVEFDTPVHEDCIQQALREDPQNREALIMAKELGIPMPPRVDPLRAVNVVALVFAGIVFLLLALFVKGGLRL